MLSRFLKETGGLLEKPARIRIEPTEMSGAACAVDAGMATSKAEVFGMKTARPAREAAAAIEAVLDRPCPERHHAVRL